ncbi:DNA-3-methyladenine glycosylase family protein [Quadrisphaera oryzae]|uniref:DNA-3-methyladenine glycosylase family protein n=1 Tax=Quadrisphaera sp. RL12-1S TaxID=2763011 RepID=UPI001C96EBD5
MTAGGAPVAQGVLVLRQPLDLSATLGALRRGGGDPAVRREGIGPWSMWWWATRTPHGPALLRLRHLPPAVLGGGPHGVVEASAWGEGAACAVDGAAELLGEDQDDSGFVPRAEHAVLVSAWRRHRGVRVPRTRAVFEALAGAAIEQVVTGVEAHRAWRDLLRRFGEPAPGGLHDAGPGGPSAPGGPAEGMRVPPSARAWAAIPSWEWLRAGVEERRRRVVLHAARCAPALERTVHLPPERVEPALRTLPGVGVWTAAEVRHRAHGDPDAFSFADYHVAKNVSYALTGEVLDDAGCAEVIECYRGHRYRVQRLLELDGVARPRRAARMTLPTHVPVATGMRS